MLFRRVYCDSFGSTDTDFFINRAAAALTSRHAKCLKISEGFEFMLESDSSIFKHLPFMYIATSSVQGRCGI